MLQFHRENPNSQLFVVSGFVPRLPCDLGSPDCHIFNPLSCTAPSWHYSNRRCLLIHTYPGTPQKQPPRPSSNPAKGNALLTARRLWSSGTGLGFKWDCASTGSPKHLYFFCGQYLAAYFNPECTPNPIAQPTLARQNMTYTHWAFPPGGPWPDR